MKLNHAIPTLAVLAILFVTATMCSAQSDPTQSSPDLSRGIELFRQGKYSDASALLKKVVKQNKTEQQAWYYLGRALIRQRELKDATKALETALKLQPNSAEAHAALGYALLLRNRLAVALSEAQVALKFDPRMPDAHYISGVAYLRLGKRELAIKEAENVSQLDPKFANAYLLKSQALVSFVGDVLIKEDSVDPSNDRYAQARDALEKFLELDPNPENNETWRAQLESLRYLATPRRATDQPFYKSAEVTTKARILSKPEPTYTQSARVNGVTGTVVLRAMFADDGTVKHIIIVSGLPDGLTENAIAVARRIKFVPATLNGHAVSMFFQLEYYFGLY